MARKQGAAAEGDREAVRYRCRPALARVCGLYRVGECDGYYTWPAPACTGPNLADLTPTEKEDYREYRELGTVEELLAMTLARDEGRLWTLRPCEEALCPVRIGDKRKCMLYRDGCCAAPERMHRIAKE